MWLHLCLCKIRFFSLYCLREPVVTTRHHWNLALHLVQTCLLTLFSWWKWRHIDVTCFEIIVAKWLLRRQFAEIVIHFFLIHKNGSLRTQVFLILTKNDRVCILFPRARNWPSFLVARSYFSLFVTHTLSSFGISQRKMCPVDFE